MKFERPKFRDILEARQIIKEYLPRTPAYSYPYLNQHLGTTVFIKHENHLPTGVFKARGAINLISRLDFRQKDFQEGIATQKQFFPLQNSQVKRL